MPAIRTLRLSDRRPYVAGMARSYRQLGFLPSQFKLQFPFISPVHHGLFLPPQPWHAACLGRYSVAAGSARSQW